MDKINILPNYIFESSWEVCNMVGGIYTVLSTRAKTLQEQLKDNLIFIGPDFGADKQNPLFLESKTLFATWRKQAALDGLHVRVGRWDVPGKPVAILVDFQPYFVKKNELYGQFWEDFKVESLHAYGDYDEASMFSYAAGLVVESFYRNKISAKQKVVYQAHEWMTGLGALYIRKHVPQIATIFTTHATTIGRSIAGNNKPLYDYLYAYNGDQMAHELNVFAKHSVEKQAAHHVDCFTTVSDVTNRECAELLDKEADVVLMNGFELDFVPSTAEFTTRRQEARQEMLHVANCLTGKRYDSENTVLVATSGRYEFKNKGIDVFIESINRLRGDGRLKKQVVAFVMVPAWMLAAREDLKARMESGKWFDTPLQTPTITHWLHDMTHDNVLGMMQFHNMQNQIGDLAQLIFVPCYLDGNDGIFNKSYYDLLIGLDLTVFPSYYEPWGYTPLESVAFKVPCITTDLAGFGQWVNQLNSGSRLAKGVHVAHRTDYNYWEVVDEIKEVIIEFAAMDDRMIKSSRLNALKIAKQALWKHFVEYYYKAYNIALTKAEKRFDK